jgi:hypothetical protein
MEYDVNSVLTVAVAVAVVPDVGGATVTVGAVA